MSNTALTSNVFFTSEQYNPIENLNDVVAETNDQLLSSFIERGVSYNLGISKADVPIQSIPLSRKNLPLKAYEISLNNGDFQGNAFVRQLNSENQNLIFTCDKEGLLKTYKYDNFGNVSIISTNDFGPLLYLGCDQVIIDSYYNAYFLTNNRKSIFIINIQTNVIYATLEFQHVSSMTMDRHDKLYVAIEDETASFINVYLNQNSSDGVQLTLLDVISLDKNNELLTDIKTISADNVLIVVSHPNEVSLYDITTFEPLSTFVNSSIKNVGGASSISAAGELSGSFVITDDGLEQDQFISTKSPYAPGNIWNDILAVKYGLPFDLTQTWLPTGKLAFSNGVCYGLDETNQLKSFQYSQTTGLPTSQTTLLNNDHTYLNCFCGTTENEVLINTQSDRLYGINLDNTTNNNVNLIDGHFINATDSILSCDYQKNSNKIIAIDESGALIKTSAQIFPKNIVTAGKSNLVLAQSQMNSIGFGLNKPGFQTQQASFIESSIFSDSTITLFDCKQTIDGALVFLGSDVNSNLIVITDIHGAHIRQFNIYNTAQCSSLILLDDTIGVYFWDGQIKFYDLSGSLLGSLTTAIVSSVGDQAFMFGSKVSSTMFMLSIVYDKTITVFTTTTGLSNFAQSFYSASLTIGSTSPYLFSGCVYGDLTSNFICLITSGNSTTQNTCKAITKLQFNSGYTSLTSSSHLIDNLNLCGVDGCITPNFLQKAIYVQKGNFDTNSTGEFFEFNMQYNTVTSTVTIPNYISPMSPFMNVSHAGNLDWYIWETVTSTGFSGIKLSISVSRRNPNRLYCLSSNGKVYTGILVGTNVVFSEFTSITGSTSYKSLSITPNVFSYDSTVYCYDLQTQNLIATRKYDKQFISSITKNDVSNTFTICVEDIKIDTVSNKTFELLFSNGGIQTSFIETKNSVDLVSQPIEIFEFQQVIDQVNRALLEAYNRLINAGGHMIASPSITMNYSTGIMTINYSSDWSQPQNKIRFNNQLLRIFKFYSLKDGSFNKLILAENSTSLQQTQKSAYLFNQLTKILFTSNSLNVNDSYVGIRGQNSVLCDIDVITSDYVNNETTLYYQPTFLRCYKIGTTLPINRINLKVLYKYHTGEEYPLLIQPGSAWSAKLQFVKQM